MTFRIVTRVRSEKAFRRTELRQHLTETIHQNRRRWATADPAQLEIWACEYRSGRFIAGLRLSDATMRQHGGRSLERPGALRPTLAAAMVNLAGAPSGVLLDPCCGSGTILGEATAVGWTATGTDIDPAAVPIAQANAPEATVQAGDALHMDFPDAAVTACVTNLPFGRECRVHGETNAWLSILLHEVARVTRPGGHVVLLTPAVPQAIVTPALKPTDTVPISLLGMKTTIWCFQRASSAPARRTSQ
jgi:tRNA G10  N-methylase Trm11